MKRSLILCASFLALTIFILPSCNYMGSPATTNTTAADSVSATVDTVVAVDSAKVDTIK